MSYQEPIIVQVGRGLTPDQQMQADRIEMKATETDAKLDTLIASIGLFKTDQAAVDSATAQLKTIVDGLEQQTLRILSAINQ